MKGELLRVEKKFAQKLKPHRIDIIIPLPFPTYATRSSMLRVLLNMEKP